MGTFSTRINVSTTMSDMTTEMVVDTGATYTVLPRAVCVRLGIIPTRRERFTYADGRTAELEVGSALIAVNGKRESSPVVFGAEDQYLLGATTLQTLGLIADTSNDRLVPAPKLPL